MRRQKGFTLIELLIVVAIIGIIAAIAIPNLLNAINRGRQKRSMSDMRTIGTAAEAYAVDLSFYPNYAEAAIGGLYVSSLQPTYVKQVPIRDGWLNPFEVKSESRFYTIVSAGRDKVLEYGLTSDSYRRPNGTASLDCDIVYSEGTFLSAPEGIQTD